MGSILQRHRQIIVPTEWKCATRPAGEVLLINSFGKSPQGGKLLEHRYSSPRRLLNEYGYIRNAVVTCGPAPSLAERIRLIVQGNDDSGKRVWEWGYDRKVNSQSVPLLKSWVVGTASTGVEAKRLAEESIDQYAPDLLRAAIRTYPAGQDFAEWVSLFDDCTDLDEDGVPLLEPRDHDYYIQLAETRLYPAIKDRELAESLVKDGKGDRDAQDWPVSRLAIWHGTWNEVLHRLEQEVHKVEECLDILSNKIITTTVLLAGKRDRELEERAIGQDEWPDVNVIEGFTYRLKRLETVRDCHARLEEKYRKKEGEGSDIALRSLRLLEDAQARVERAEEVLNEVSGLTS
jgi:hypothetical protein